MKPQHILLFLTFLLAVPILHWMRQTPTEPPVATNPPTYHEMFRPGYHYSCPTNWMNDPNGLIFANGKYHLYYQFNPHDIVWGDMSWGHATSTDLVHWENLPVAIEMYNDIMIFSGCNIIDVNNTSGLCEKPGCLLAYYTAQSSTEEAQAIAYSNDNGTSYQQYEGNPILAFNLHDFRDPKVIWYEKGQKWIMVVALSAVFKLQLYGSTDLINWTLLSEFGGEGSTAGVWEDPDIFELPIDEQGNTKWVIAHSVAVNCVEYYIGEFDGETFTNTETKGELLFFDYGFDFDESASWNNEPNGRRLMIAYLDDGDYGGALPTQGWRGQLTMIRELKIKRYPEGLRIISQPIPELAILRDNHYNYDNIEINKENSNVTLEFHGAQLEIIAEFVLPKDSNEIPKEFGIKVFTGKNQTTIIGYNTTAELLFVDRKNSGLVDFCQHFAAISNTTFKIENGTIKFHVFVDHSSVEVFVDDGRIVMTNLIFPDPSQDAVEVYAVGGSVTISSIDAWTLKDIWSNDKVKAEPKEENSFLASFDHISS